MTNDLFDWSLWQECVGSGLDQVMYPNVNTLNTWLAQQGVNKFRPAAVMMLIQESDEAEVVLTVRSSRLHQHGGQVSFAGGKFDVTDTSLLHTALRETHEELGIVPETIEVIGQMPPLPTVSAYQVHPFIGVIKSFVTMRPNADEVDKVFTVPLAQLMQPSNYQAHQIIRNEHVLQTIIFPHQEYIWGVTATILLALAQRYQAYLAQNNI